MDKQAAIRRVRIAVSVFFGVVALAFCVLWVRSYSVADRIHGVIWRPTSFVVASKSGRVSVVLFRWHGAPSWWRWQIVSHPTDDELSFPFGAPKNYERLLGFGWLHDPLYMVMRSIQILPDGTEVFVFGAATASLRGAGPMVPYWFLVVISIALSTSTWLQARIQRFSLRTMLIATTLVAVVLGLAAWMTR